MGGSVHVVMNILWNRIHVTPDVASTAEQKVNQLFTFPAKIKKIAFLFDFQHLEN